MLRLALVGAGIMGANHGRVARQLRDARVTCVVDSVPQRAEALALSLDAIACTDLAHVAAEADAAIIAVPTHLHREVAEDLLVRGLHVLVEKPLAGRADDAHAIVACARAAGRVLQVGHVERYNPAVVELSHHVDQLLHIDIQRISPFSPRVTEGVLQDLMIHDVDIALSLAASPVASVQAVARHTSPDRGEDLASALLVFENGVTASLTASRVGQNKIRSISLTQATNFIAVDLLRQSLTINRVHHAEYLGATGMSYRQTGVIEVPFIENSGEPLLLELAAFVDACLAGSTPRVSGEDGLRAVEVVEMLAQQAVRTGLRPSTTPSRS